MYPRGLTDEDLAETLARISAEVEQRYGTPNLWMNPELIFALQQIGLQEQSRRLAVDASESARSATRVCLAIAAAALLIALFGTVSDYFGDRSWQQDQEQIAREQSALLMEIRDKLP